MNQRPLFRFLKPALPAGILLATLCAFPPVARADEEPPAEKKTDTTNLADKRVTLKVEEVSLTAAIKMLMKSVGADFSIDPALRDSYVTAHLTNVRLSVALNTLMKVSTLPAEYHIEGGVYIFEPRKAAPPPEIIRKEEPKPEPFKPRFETIKLNNADAAHIAWLLGGQPFQVLGQNYGAIGTGDFSGSKTFSNGGIGGSGLFGGSGSVILGNGGNGNRQNSSSDFRNGFGNLLNLLLGGGSSRRR